jgi:hypothetical protein
MSEFDFSNTEICTIDKINYSPESGCGTCRLNSPDQTYVMTWTIANFPMESAGMPGSPYPIKISWNIIDKNTKTTDDSAKSISGYFIYHIHSGTLPDLSPMGIKHGQYYCSGTNGKTNKLVKALFKINQMDPSVVYLFN